MTSSASPTPEPFAAALRLLLLGELIVLALQILFDPLAALSMRFLLSPGQSNRGFHTAYSIVSLLPKGVIGFGLLRLASALENEKVLRWAWIALILLVAQVADTLRHMVFPVSLRLGEELGMAQTLLAFVSYLVNAAGLGATLMAVWTACRVRELRPPLQLFLAIAGLVGVNFVGRIVAQFLLFQPGYEAVLIALRAPGLAIPALFAGTFFQIRSELRRAPEGPAEVSEWQPAARGLTLWLRGVYASIAVGMLAAALAYASFSMLEMRPIVMLTTVFSVPFAMIVTGLFRYARVPQSSGARAPAFVAISLHVLAFSALAWLADPMLAVVPRVLGLVGTGFLIQSFMRAAPALADTTKRVGQGLLLSSGVTLVLSFFEMPRGGLLSILAFVAALASLVYGVRFLALVSRMRHQLGPQSAAPTGPLFANS